MPIYEYHCDDCGTNFEKLIRNATDGKSLCCPSCGKNHLRQRLSTFAAHANSAPNSAGMCPSGGVCPTPGLCGKN